jgi:carbonic anhydrase
MRAWNAPWLLLLLLGGAPGCDKIRAVVCEPVTASAPAPKTLPKHTDLGDAGAPPEKLSEPAEPIEKEPPPESNLLTAQAARYALPFAWEKSPKEPLARTRTFLRELADDNTRYMTKGAPYFQALAAGETPRATVVTCADARVQAGAYDDTPENDDFTVRNIGNQLQSSLGSVNYGIEELRTPVLLILGHTGCTAVKAAMDDARDMPAATRRELAAIKVKKPKGKNDEHAWAAAVVENVHNQVKVALREFGPHVNAAELTIVGAVYDLRNELGRGPGRLIVLNVNGNQDPARLKAFAEAILSTPNPHAKSNAHEDPLERLARALSNPGPARDDSDPENEEPEAEEPVAPSEPHPATEAQGVAKQAPGEHGTDEHGAAEHGAAEHGAAEHGAAEPAKAEQPHGAEMKTAEHARPAAHSSRERQAGKQHASAH